MEEYPPRSGFPESCAPERKQNCPIREGDVVVDVAEGADPRRPCPGLLGGDMRIFWNYCSSGTRFSRSNSTSVSVRQGEEFEPSLGKPWMSFDLHSVATKLRELKCVWCFVLGFRVYQNTAVLGIA